MYPDDTTKKVRAQVVTPIQIYLTAEVTLKRQGDRYAEVLYMAKKSRPNIRKLNKDEYVELNTGEIKRFKQSDGKMRETLRHTFRELKGLIRSNFSADDPSQKFVTLTYRENMTDPERLLKDFKAFWMRLQRSHKRWPMKYIAVAEPQGRGAWHMHVMIKSDEPGLWIDKDKLKELWGHGRTEIEQLKSDDVGNYYVAYFTSLAAEIDGGEVDPLKPTNKAYVKGGRLQFYPKGFRFYRCSQSIRRPTQEEIEHWRVQDEYGKAKYKQAYELQRVEDDGGADDAINFIQREMYDKNLSPAD